MIPLKLRIKNFLSYADNVPELNFEPFKMLLFSGNNGHGKSAIFDAITWNIWGRARGKTNDQLIHYGSRDMFIDFEFIVNKNRYKVIRRCSIKGNKNKIFTDLQFQTQSDGNPVSLTKDTIRETQKFIETIIGMDYETFLNSAFLAQGHSDEFTRKTPIERKEILAGLLGLDLYDHFQELTKNRINERKQSLIIFDEKFTSSTEKIKDLPLIEDELKKIQTTLDANYLELKSLASGKNKLQEEINTLQGLEVQKTLIRKQINSLKEEIDLLNNELKESQNKLLEYQGITSNSDLIINSYNTLKSLKEREKTLTVAFQKYGVLKEKSQNIQNKINEEKTKMMGKIDHLSTLIIKELQPRFENLKSYEVEKINLNEKLVEIANEKKFFATKEQQLNEIDINIGETQGLKEKIKQDGESLRVKLKLLDTSIKVDCPLCGKNLEAHEKTRLNNQYETEINQHRSSYKTKEKNLQRLLIEREKIQKEFSNSKDNYEKHSKVMNNQLSTLNFQIEQAKTAEIEILSNKKIIQTIENQLETKSYCNDLFIEKKSIDIEIKNTGFDFDVLKGIQEEIQKLDSYESLKQKLDFSLNNIQKENLRRNKLKVFIKERTEQSENLAKEIKSFDMQLDTLDSKLNLLTELNISFEEIEKIKNNTLTHKGSLESQFLELNNKIKEQKRIIKDSNEMRKELELLEVLSEGFGRNGVQAMIIESMLPFIEEQANLLLAKMTDHRMHVSLNTIKETKAGDVRETLDIFISDELGTRNYEMFSGGEAFRIDLALRIAISKALVMRKGLPSLSILIIDEGFGTQDAIGKELIVDVLTSIEDDFDKIFVITHLEDLKELFPSRVEVAKTENGSTFSIQ